MQCEATLDMSRNRFYVRIEPETMRWSPSTAFLSGVCLVLVCVVWSFYIVRIDKAVAKRPAPLTSELPAIRRPPHKTGTIQRQKPVSPTRDSLPASAQMRSPVRRVASTQATPSESDDFGETETGHTARSVQKQSLDESAGRVAGGGPVRGTIAGTVFFRGTVPPERPLDLSADPHCARMHRQGVTTSDYVVGTNGALANVFVYLKDIPFPRGGVFPPPSKPVVLDQRACLYQPSVFGVQVGQELQIVNSDATLHNVKTQPNNQAGFNKSQPVQGMKFSHWFTKPEVGTPVKVKCDVHPWMLAYLFVLPHPYFDVTEEEGTFEIAGVYAGECVVEAWHPKAGARTQIVNLDARETKRIVFEFQTQNQP